MSDTLEGTSPHISDRYITREIAGEALTMGQVVQMDTTNQTVKKTTTAAGAAGIKPCGICITSAAINKSVSVLWRGRARATAFGTITAGDIVTSCYGGLIQTKAAISATDLTGTSAAIAAVLNTERGIIGFCEIGAPSGGNAVIFMI